MTSRSFAISRFWTRKRLNWLRCNRWVRLIDTDKNLGTALVESQWIEDQVQIWLNKMTRHITEAEALAENHCRSSNVWESSQIVQSSQVSLKKSRKVFLRLNSRSTTAPSFRIFAKIHKQPIIQQDHLAISAIFCLGTAGVFLSSYLQPVVKICKHVIGSHAPIIDCAETAQLEEHDIMFTFDSEALHPSIKVWPSVGGLCLFRRCRTTHSTFLFTGTRPGRVFL